MIHGSDREKKRRQLTYGDGHGLGPVGVDTNVAVASCTIGE